MLGTSRRIVTLSAKVSVVAGLVLVAGACSFVFDADKQQCATDTDCVNYGTNAICADRVCVQSQSVTTLDAGDDAPSDPIWGCIGKVPVPTEDRSAEIEVPIRLLDGAGSAGLPNVGVAACEEADPDCASPLEATRTLRTDEEGSVTVPVFSGFKGFFKLTTGEGGDGPPLMPTFIPALPIPNKDLRTRYVGVWPVFQKGIFTSLALVSGGQEPKDQYAHVFFVSLRCDGNRAAGTRITVEPVANETYGFYTDPTGLPSRTIQETSKEGAGGVVNLPPGLSEFTVKRDAPGAQGIVSKRKIFLRAGSLTLITFDPL